MKRTDLNAIKYPRSISSSDRRFCRNLINKVRDFINVNSINNIGIACSAGHDSICLADICSKISTINNTKFHLLYVNHNLRKEENLLEISLIKKIAYNYKFGYSILDGTVIKGSNLEERARIIRYTSLKNEVSKLGLKGIFTAHNASEDKELIIMRLIDNRINLIKDEKSSQRIIYGMKQISKVYDLDVYRPLLFFNKDELNQYVKIMCLDWHEDSSNIETKYKRNNIRHNIIPLLKSINPSF
jgi:tRNA(Ile)-lysidine synthase